MLNRHIRPTAPDTGFFKRFRSIELAVILVVFIVGLILWVQQTRGIFDPPYLILSLNVAIILIPAVLIAAISVLGFYNTGSWPVLALGAGTLTIAISTVVGSALLPTTSVNASEMSQEVITFAAAGFYLSGAFFAYNKIYSEQERKSRLSAVIQLYIGLLIFTVFIIVISVLEILPPFFVQGQGGTPMRNLLVFTSMFILLVAGGAALRQYFSSRTPLLFWYGLGLVMLAMSEASDAVETTIGSPIDWLGRIALILGIGGYMLAAALVAIQEARARKIPAGDVMAEKFSVMEKRLKESEERFKILTETSPMAISVSTFDGKLLYVNNEFVRLSGYTKGELEGKITPDFYRDAGERMRALDILKNQGSVQDYEIRFRRKNGELIWANVYMRPFIFGEHQAIFGMTVDVTMRKRAEEEREDFVEQLRRAKDSLEWEKSIRKALMENTGAQLAYLDKNFNFVMVNASYEKGCGHSKSELDGKNHFELFPHSGNQEIFERVRDTGVAESFFEKPFTFTDQPWRGTTYWDWTLTPLKDSREQVQGMVLSLIDVTERKKLDQAKDEFISLVSHELRTPLTIISGSLRTAMSENMPPEDIKTLIENAIDGSQSMDIIINNLLELSRAQSNKLELAAKSLDIYRTVDEVVEKVRLSYPERKYTIMKLADIQSIVADPVRFERILYNLVENAAKYSPDDSEIKIDIDTRDSSLLVSVTDQGIGIPKDRAHELFEPFKRLLTQSQHSKGMGLGLVVCKRLVEAHGGEIWVDSELEQGATLRFTLPLKSQAN